MPYLPVDLDGKRKAMDIELALNLPRFSVVGGLLELWERVWRDKSAMVDDIALCAAFGPDMRLRAALVSRDFLEPWQDGLYRVKGAEKWLFGLEGKSRGGKAAAKNLRRGNKPGLAGSPAGGSAGNIAGEPKTAFPGVPGGMPEDGSRQEPRLLHPEAQHPAPTLLPSEEEKRASPPPKGPRLDPDKPEDAWDGVDFWLWTQERRRAGGFAEETAPQREVLDRWWSKCLMSEGVTCRAMRVGFVRGFGADPYWEARGFPFRAFLKGWASYVRLEGGRNAATG